MRIIILLLIFIVGCENKVASPTDPLASDETTEATNTTTTTTTTTTTADIDPYVDFVRNDTSDSRSISINLVRSGTVAYTSGFIAPSDRNIKKSRQQVVASSYDVKVTHSSNSSLAYIGYLICSKNKSYTIYTDGSSFVVKTN